LNVAIEHRLPSSGPAQERPPYASYAAILGAFTAGLAGVSALGRAFRKPEPQLSALDLLALGGATFKAARSLSNDRVGSFIRAPFVQGEAVSGEAERPAGEGLQQAIGELVTCTRCVGTWSAGALTSLLVLSPRFGRLLVWTLNGAAVNDFLQAAFAAACAKANELERKEL
jgi:hypothetical protein